MQHAGEPPVRSPDTVVVSGYARLPKNTGAGLLYSVLALVLRVDTRTNEVLDVSTTLATRVAEDFLREQLIGRDLVADQSDIVSTIETRYLAHAQKALVVAFRDLSKRYGEFQNGPTLPR